MRTRPQPVRAIAVKKLPQTTKRHMGTSRPVERPAAACSPSRMNLASMKAVLRQNT
ncbi:Uncharacterised protein [Mycobacterium tuberculosis]|nr:Uncharacterised protein [Mycobacterium tuberculosis]